MTFVSCVQASSAGGLSVFLDHLFESWLQATRLLERCERAEAALAVSDARSGNGEAGDARSNAGSSAGAGARGQAASGGRVPALLDVSGAPRTRCAGKTCSSSAHLAL
jgi:hypothetical protein